MRFLSRKPLAADNTFHLTNGVEVLLRALDVDLSFATSRDSDGGFAGLHVAQANRALFEFLWTEDIVAGWCFKPILAVRHGIKLHRPMNGLQIVENGKTASWRVEVLNRNEFGASVGDKGREEAEKNKDTSNNDHEKCCRA